MLLSFSALVLMILVVLFVAIYDRNPRFKHNFNTELGILFMSLILAIFGAKWGHGQNPLLSAWAQYLMFFYLFYYFLHALRIRPQELEKLMIIMAVAFVGLFVLQYVLYPTIIFGVRAQEARGTIRIFIPGSAFAGLMYFYFLRRIVTTGDLKYVPFCFIFMVIPVLQGTRSSIAILLFGTLLFIIVSRQVRSKILILMLLLSGVVAVFFIFQDIFMTLVEVSHQQTAQESEDIRVRAARFYLYDFYPTKLNYFTGNGKSHMMSAYGMKMWYYKSNYGFYQNDIGLIGEFTQFGVLWVISVLLIIRKFFTIRIEKKYSYIKYWAILLFINEVLGGMFSNSTAIVVICCAMYIYDVSNFELQQPEEDEALVVT